MSAETIPADVLLIAQTVAYQTNDISLVTEQDLTHRIALAIMAYSATRPTEPASAPPADAGDREGTVEAVAGNRFEAYSNESLAGQCRMEARASLHPDMQGFMMAVSDRLRDHASALATLTEKLASERAAREKAQALEKHETAIREEACRRADAATEKAELMAGELVSALHERDVAEAALAQAQADRERAAEDALDGLMWHLDHVRNAYCMQIRQFLIKRGAMRPESRVKMRAALRTSSDQASSGGEVDRG